MTPDTPQPEDRKLRSSSSEPPEDFRAAPAGGRSLFRRAARWTVWTGLGLFVGLAALFAFVQTRTGKDLLASWAATAIEAGTGTALRIDGIEGLVPFDFSIRSATLGSTADPWLRIEELSLLWFPESLFKGRLHVGRVGAGKVTLLRRPPEGPEDAASEPGGTIWPPSLPPLLVDRLFVESFSVDQGVFGEAARLTASGRVAVTGEQDTIRGDLRVQRLDAPEERALVRWVLETDPVRLELDLQVIEPENGMLSRLAGIRPGALQLRFSGHGPPDDWRGEIDAESSAWGGIRSTLRVDASRDRLDVEAEGGLRVREELVSDEAAGLLQNGTGAFSFRGSITDQGLVIVDRLNLDAEGAEMSVSGRFRQKERAGEARVQLTLPDLRRIRWPGLTSLAGRLEAGARFHGTLDAPEVDLDLEVRGLRAAGVEAGFATGSFRVVPAKNASFPSLEGLRFQGEGAFHDVAFLTAEPPVRRKRADWDFDMHFTSPETLSIATLRLADAGLEAELSGSVQLAGPSLDGSLRLTVDDLSRAPFLEGSGIQGKGVVSALVKADGMSRSVLADVNGRFQGVGPVPAGLRPLLGEGGDFQGRISLQEGRRVQVARFRMALPATELSVEGEADLVEETGRASIQADIPDLGVLSSLAGRSMAGEAVVRAEVRGPFAEPGADVQVTARDVEVEGVSVQEVRASFETGRLLPAPAGRLRVELIRGDEIVAARADVTVNIPLVEMKNVSVQGAGARVSGGLIVHSRSGTVGGDLNGSVQDLAPVGALLGRDLGGSAGFALHLSRDGVVQDATLDLRAEDVTSFFGDAERIDLRGDFRNLLREPAGSVTARVEAFRRDDLRLEEVVLNTRGKAGDLSFDVKAHGEAGAALRVSSKGALRRSDGQDVLELESLEGAYGGHDMRLSAPAGIRFPSKGGFETPGLRIRMGGGGLALEGVYGGEIDLKAELEALPLSLLTLAGAPSVEGTAGGRVRLSGTPRSPRLEAELAGEGVRPGDPSLENLPGFRVTSTSILEDGRLEGRLSVAEQDGSFPLEAMLRMPARVSLSPLSIDLPRDGEIQGRLAADLDLEPIPAWLALEDQRVSGRLQADLSISGSMASPAVMGDARVREGSLEVLGSGSLFRNLDVLVRMDGTSMVLVHAGADDGSDGSIKVDGWFQPLPEQDFPFEGRVSMDGFHLLRLDEITAVTGGDLHISGTARKADLSGTVRVSSAEVRIPDRLPPKIHELNVVEVNGQAVRETGAPGEGPSEPLQIGLNVDVEIPGRAFIRGRGLDSEWEGKLRVGGTAALPEVRGELSIVRGHYDFFGDRFSLASGTVFFDGSNPPKPLLEITAERRKADMTGRVILSGTPDSLSVRVTSDPPMPQDEVMARLLFDRSLASITPVQALKLARALDSLAGRGTFGFVDRAQRAVGLDRIEVVQSDEENGSTALSLGKYVREDAYVEVEKGLEGDEGKVSVEYELTPRITVETEVGADSAGGVEVKWKWDY